MRRRRSPPHLRLDRISRDVWRAVYGAWGGRNDLWGGLGRCTCDRAPAPPSCVDPPTAYVGAFPRPALLHVASGPHTTCVVKRAAAEAFAGVLLTGHRRRVACGRGTDVRLRFRECRCCGVRGVRRRRRRPACLSVPPIHRNHGAVPTRHETSGHASPGDRGRGRIRGVLRPDIVPTATSATRLPATTRARIPPSGYR